MSSPEPAAGGKSLRSRLARELVDFPITWSLVLVYVSLFVLMTLMQGNLMVGGGPLTFLSLSVDTLVDFGAIDGRRIFEENEWWRLLTATLLHASVIHLALNLSALIQLGRIVEDWYGGWALMVLHVVLGLAGSLASLWVHRMMPGRLIQVGGSGAIFGLAGFLLLATYFEDEEDSPQMFRSLAISLLIGFGLGSFLGADDAAHVGGALAGAAFGTVDYAFKRDYWPKWFARLLGIAAASLIVVAFGGASLSYGEASSRRHAEAIQAQKRLEEVRQGQLRRRAGAQLMTVYQYAVAASAQDNPPALERRAERAALLNQLAGQIDDPALADYLRKVAELLMPTTDDEFTSPDHLRRLVELITGPAAPAEQNPPAPSPPKVPANSAPEP
jgi:rhomboid protease GluP